jgi:hypothetical protein
MVGRRSPSPTLVAAEVAGHWGERNRFPRTLGRAWRWLLPIVAVLALVTIPAIASDRVDLRFEIFGFAGLHLLTTQTSADLTPDGYSIAVNINTRGIVSAFVDLHSRSEVYGKLSQQSAHPDAYHSEVLRNGTERDYGVKYLADGDVINTQAPSRRKSIKIDPAQLRGTVDQLTAYFLVERQLGRTGSCGTVVPVYDGNEVYRMRFTDIKDETLIPDRHQSFSGATRLCEIVRDVVVANPDVEESTYDRARLWYARLLPDGRMLPVRMEYETPFGNVEGYLADISGFGMHLNFEGE